MPSTVDKKCGFNESETTLNSNDLQRQVTEVSTQSSESQKAQNQEILDSQKAKLEVAKSAQSKNQFETVVKLAASIELLKQLSESQTARGFVLEILLQQILEDQKAQIIVTETTQTENIAICEAELREAVAQKQTENVDLLIQLQIKNAKINEKNTKILYLERKLKVFRTNSETIKVCISPM